MPSVYQQTKHKRTIGMVNTVRASKCVNCGGLAASQEMFKGWCVRCFESWKGTADPVMLAQAALGYSPTSCLPAPTPRQVETITEAIIKPKNDEAYLPLLLFKGGVGLGRMQAMFNLAKTMETLELQTTGDVLRLTQGSHDTSHRCGLHAPVQRASLDGFFSRVLFAQKFAPIEEDHHLREYIRWFCETNRIYLISRTPISATAERSRHAWRQVRIKFEPLSRSWPYLRAEESVDHEAILSVDRLIPRTIPEQWRQDMCQDLMVAVLSGEVSIENLKDAAPKYIKQVWPEHPYKYGPLSLDAPPPWAHDDARTLGQLIAASVQDDSCGHDHGSEMRREVNARISIGDVLRHKNCGVLPIRVERDEYVMDEDIHEIYQQDQRGR